MLRAVCILAGALALPGVSYGDDNRPASDVTRAQAAPPHQWRTASSDNFQVYGTTPERELRNWAGGLEALRRELSEKWLGRAAPQRWAPRCIVVVHSSASSYLRAVPRGEFTAGSSLFEARGETVTARRIDVRSAPVEELRGTLAHELVHLIIAERFKQLRVPAWADEGIAVLEDSAEPQRVYRAKVLPAASQNRLLSLSQVFQLDGSPNAEFALLFYGQSASLTEFLVARASPDVFVLFIERAIERGHEAALRAVYQIENVEEFQQYWNRALAPDSFGRWTGDSRRAGALTPEAHR